MKKYIYPWLIVLFKVSVAQAHSTDDNMSINNIPDNSDLAKLASAMIGINFPGGFCNGVAIAPNIILTSNSCIINMDRKIPNFRKGERINIISTQKGFNSQKSVLVEELIGASYEKIIEPLDSSVDLALIKISDNVPNYVSEQNIIYNKDLGDFHSGEDNINLLNKILWKGNSTLYMLTFSNNKVLNYITVEAYSSITPQFGNKGNITYAQNYNSKHISTFNNSHLVYEGNNSTLDIWKTMAFNIHSNTNTILTKKISREQDIGSPIFVCKKSGSYQLAAPADNNNDCKLIGIHSGISNIQDTNIGYTRVALLNNPYFDLIRANLGLIK